MLSFAGGPESGETIVVTTSMLEHAVNDVSGGVANIEIVTLIPPGSCPGHFDLSPRLVPLINRASLVIRHDYQGMLEERIRKRAGDNINVLTVETGKSLLIPQNTPLLLSVLQLPWRNQTGSVRSERQLPPKTSPGG